MNITGISGYGFYQYSQQFNKNIEFVSEEEAKEIDEEFTEILHREEQKILDGRGKTIREQDKILH